LALAHGLEGTRAPLAAPPPATKAPLPLRADGSPRYLAWLEAELDARAGGFLAASAAARQAALAALDAESFPPGPPLGPPAAFGPNPWCKVKALILTGYYTSEEGAARELQYQLIPGRFDPDAPLHPGDRAWSSDWTAVDFG
ncbi:MAG TPA: gluconate 2-dehydrogenase subunit 3 family protein, partial [Novosphingobium sp.]|nr:gluconate 2-dehydrogenase subunit 3 family protein [Novosphingobium sp.]